MKIEMSRTGEVFLMAENIDEAQKLVALMNSVTASLPKVEKVRKIKRNHWANKPKVECAACGKMCKNLKLHTLRKHPVQQ